MKIYFSASVKGGREYADVYAQIIELLKTHGEVITEYLGNKTLTDRGDMHLDDKEIYERDMKWLQGSDVVVAEVTAPSLGVGYEIASAENLGKKVLCLYKEISGRSLSSMIKGNTHVTVETYNDIEDVSRILKKFFAYTE